MKLYRKARGKEAIVEEGDAKTLRKRMAELRRSQRGGVSGQAGRKYRVEYRISE